VKVDAGRSTAREPAGRLPGLAVAAFHVTLLAGVALAYATLLDSTAGTVSGFDYYSLHASARRADRGWDPYGPVVVVSPRDDAAALSVRHPNLNAPVFVAATIPLSRLGPERGYRVLMLVTLALTLAAVPFLLATMPAGTPRMRTTLDLVLVLALFFPLFLSVRLGQVGHALLLPVAFGWWGLRTGRDRAAGAALGVAFALKVFFGLFLVMLLLRRRGRAAASMVVTALATSALGCAVLGWRSLVDYARALGSVDWFTQPWNASLLGFLGRVTSVGQTSSWPYLTLAGALAWGTAVGLLLYGLWRVCDPADRTVTRRRLDGAFGFTLVAMLLISPLGWLYYLPLLAVPLVIAQTSGRMLTKGLVAAGWLLCAVPFDQRTIEELTLGDGLWVQGGFACYGLLAVAAGMLALSSRRAPPPRASVPPTEGVGTPRRDGPAAVGVGGDAG
jgi:hypothetical protein